MKTEDKTAWRVTLTVEQVFIVGAHDDLEAIAEAKMRVHPLRKRTVKARAVRVGIGE